MRILIIDDSAWKVNDIVSYIKNIDNTIVVDFSKGACDGLYALFESAKRKKSIPYDLIFLDRQMPLHEDEYEIEADAGEFVLEELERTENKTPVCTISSEVWNPDFENVIYNLRYDSSVDLSSKIQEVLNLIRK